MNWTNLPSLSSLRAFEAAARCLGYSAAGRELNVSHAAIAQQVRQLETFLGTPLLHRQGRGLAPSENGALLAARLSDGFGVIEDAVRDTMKSEETRPLHITMTPGFAQSWFLPRLRRFREAHPEIDLMVNPSAGLVDLARDGFDVGIRFGGGEWPGVAAEPLFASSFVVVAAPALFNGKTPCTPEELADYPLLQEVGTNELVEWLTALGMDPAKRLRTTHLPGNLLLSAVRDAQGIGATARAFVEDDIAAGRLISLFEDKSDPRSGYYLIRRPGVARPAVKKFRSWILREAVRSGAAVPDRTG